jgi:cytochrome c oxidase subunit 2
MPALRGSRRRAWPLCLALAVVLGLIGGAAPAWAGALIPERGGSPNADRIASLYTVVLVIAGVVFTGVVTALTFMLFRYRESRSPVAARIHGNTRLEIAWTVAATVLIVFIATFSFVKLGAIEDPDRAAASPAAVAAGLGSSPQGQLHIQVVGRQYVWMFKYPNGAFSYEEMVAPVGVTVDLDIVSVDVAHAWWIPKLGGKFDAIPGYTNHTWFRIPPKLAGRTFTGQCAELCGRNHADMTARVRAVTPAAYVRWLRRQRQLIDTANAPAPQGRAATKEP